MKNIFTKYLKNTLGMPSNMLMHVHVNGRLENRIRVSDAESEIENNVELAINNRIGNFQSVNVK